MLAIRHFQHHVHGGEEAAVVLGGDRGLAFLLGLVALEEPPRDDGWQSLAEADVGEELLFRARAAFAYDALPARIVDLGQRALHRAQRLVEQALAEARRLLVLHRL